MKTLFTHVEVVPMTKEETLPDHYVVVSENKITYLGSTPPDYPVDQVIDGTGKVLMPGLINMHTHTAMTYFRSAGDGRTLHDWLTKEIFPKEAKLTEEDVYYGSLLGILEHLAAGTTCFNDMYFLTDGVLKAVLKSGIRAMITYHGVCNEETADFEALENTIKNRRLYEKYNGYNDNQILVSVAPHAIYSCCKSFLQFEHNEAKRMNTFLHTHLSETIKENEDCEAQHRKSPTEYLNSLSFFAVPTIVAHAVHLSEQDRKILKTHNVTVVTNPESNLKLGSGIAEVDKLLEEGINVTIGTDGASSNNNLNLWEEMHLLSFLLNGVYQKPQVIPPFEILKMATINAAKALKLEEQLGTIEVGKKADLILVDTSKPHWNPNHNTISNLVYTSQASDVFLTMVNGTILYQDGCYRSLDKEQIYREVKERWSHLI